MLQKSDPWSDFIVKTYERADLDFIIYKKILKFRITSQGAENFPVENTFGDQ